MPYLGVDPWRQPLFAGAPCPRSVRIPVDEIAAWDVHPERRWIHNKLDICRTQGLEHGPHGTMPRRFPVFSKPIYNLRGMGTGSRVVRSAAEYRAVIQPGHFWMRLLRGAHVSTDVALENGRARWWRHTTGVPGRGGTFDRWTVHARRRPALERYVGRWLRRHLAGFTGIVNFETIGGRIVECHLRMSDQWLDLNGAGWLEAVAALYRTGRWRWREPPRRAGYSVVLFGRHGRRWRIASRHVRAAKSVPGVVSVQITFDPKRAPAAHAMPPGGFRLAIVNATSLAAGRRARAILRRGFRSRPI